MSSQTSNVDEVPNENENENFSKKSINNENEESDIMQTENEENEDEKKKRLIGFLSLEQEAVQNLRYPEIIKQLYEKNPANKIPNFIVKIGNSLKLIFYDEMSRNNAANEGLFIDGTKINIEKPREKPKFWKKLLQIFGVPIDDDDRKVINFLEKDPNIKVISGLKWLNHKGTEIKNGGRSVLVEIPVGHEIPGYKYYSSPNLTKTGKVQIWYPGIAKWCRECTQKNHIAKDCPNKTTQPKRNVQNENHPFDSQGNSIYTPNPRRVRGWENIGIQSVIKPIVQSTANDDPTPMESLGVRPTKIKESTNIVPFFGPKHPFSNHYAAHFTIDDVDYSTTEQYLFAEKAKKVDDRIRLGSIMRNHTGRAVKKIGEETEWDSEIHGDWHDFAIPRLKIANRAKFSQNKLLRKRLFATWGTTLVECNPNDQYWGIAMKQNDPYVNDRKKWNGRNVFGYLLTEIRDELMKNADFQSDLPQEIGDGETFLAKKRVSVSGLSPLASKSAKI